MAAVRRRLRLLGAIGLALQVAWLTALVPRDCCAAHRPPQPKKSCHEAAAATHCPMRGTHGTPCPMHRSVAERVAIEQAVPAAHDHHSAPTSTDCRLSGTCNGPMAAFFALLTNPGILPESATASPDVEARRVASPVRDDVVGRFQPPDPPPPRA